MTLNTEGLWGRWFRIQNPNLKIPPFGIRYIEFLNLNFKFEISDPKIPEYQISIKRKLRKNVAIQGLVRI